MRQKLKYYQGYEITQEVITKINTISFQRYSEGSYGMLYEDYEDFEDLCLCNEFIPEHTYITLGEDWFIIYTKEKSYININEWVSLSNVSNKFTQTIEMFNELKKILLSSEDKNITSLMKHNTSYKFYLDFLNRGFLQEYQDGVIAESFMPSDVEKVVNSLIERYDYLGYFFKDEKRNKHKEEIIEDYIYHNITFGITDKFKTRYKK